MIKTRIVCEPIIDRFFLSISVPPNMVSFQEIRTKLDDSKKFSQMEESPFYRDAVYEKFSDQEYERRRELVRDFMRKEGFDCLVVGGGPSHWSSCYGMGWLSGHTREWHSVAAYLVFPLKGEPTLVYSMGGTHIEAVRRSVSVKDVRSSQNGKFGEVIAQRIRELGFSKGKIGITEIDSRFHEFIPVNHCKTIIDAFPNANFSFVQGLFHELWTAKSQEELSVIQTAASICDRAIEAIVKRVHSGVKEYELRAAAAHAVMESGADFNFIILGSTPMSDPHMFFGNPRPSSRTLKSGDIILNEIAVEYRGFQAQLGTPICVGDPPSKIVEFFDEIVLPGFNHIAETLRPGNTLEDIRRRSRFFREKGYQSRPIILHGLGVSSEGPEVFVDHIEAEPYEFTLKPNMTLMLEPNPIMPNGSFGIFLGHSFSITNDGHRRLTNYPLQLTLVH
jgi:Xaa-Pro aminopeptidase